MATRVSASVDVLIPTCNRPAALAVTLTSLFGQTERPLRIVVSDQSDPGDAAVSTPELSAVLRLLHASPLHEVALLKHLPRRGLAEQRQFLLDQARSSYALFLDDDVILEADLVSRMLRAIRATRCGFVGSAVIGLSFIHDERPHQQAIEFWEGEVEPECILPGDPRWARHHLHSAANLWHVQQRLGLDGAHQRMYRVAWVGGCVLYDTAKLREAGGFEFWRQLPREHCGEDVLAQLRVMARHGGCGLIPSGAYHQELPTTVPRREVDAPRVLSDLIPLGAPA
ncbi:MAG TPA: glycosyltransferase family 2 protein [Burkholderiaceae bacterium]|nr:glycosyltransferase family 2 protein [Burkholderiaceae bacterium]